MTVAVQVTYRGDRALVCAFAAMLEGEGLTLAWQLPAHPRGMGEVSIGIVEPSISVLTLDEIVAAAIAAIARFHQRFLDRA